ncbi:MAG TPA: gluconate 2-dehydrogenase subunit 3 family protein [Bryobacteraceae bacterium]|jgi:hypothetical protein|nr:gluconate 2-dehydrogenase subunit 3 family protein [Bryobacteraceae bacterium]
MKRRRFFQTVAALPAAQALLAQSTTTSTSSQNPAQKPVSPPPTPAPGGRGARGPSPIPDFEESSYEAVSEYEPKFFTAPQYAALKRLCALLQPAHDGNPSAVECQAPEFLDFLVSAEMPDRQKLYRDGLDLLNSSAKKKFQKDFASLDDTQADAVVRPMLVPIAWEKDMPKDPTQHFMAQAHRDIRTATQNSREWATAGASTGRRRFGGSGNFITPIDPVYRSN